MACRPELVPSPLPRRRAPKAPVVRDACTLTESKLLAKRRHAKGLRSGGIFISQLHRMHRGIS